MTEITDEMLMRYADGALDDKTRSMIARRVRGDAGLERRLAPFLATTKARLRVVGEDILDHPMPPQLVASALALEKALTACASGARLEAKPPGRLDRLIDRLTAWRPSSIPKGAALLTMSGALAALAMVMGYVARQVPEPDGFRIVMETARSNEEIRFSRDGATIRLAAVTSFKSKDGRFCRKYMLTKPDRSRREGIACRDGDGRWRIDVEADAGVVDDKDFVAVSETSIDQRMTEMIDGNSLGRKEEDEILRKGWKAR